MLYLKNLHLTIPVVLTYLLFSCSQPQNCNNGVQDGSETGIDCGGNCPPCPSNNNNNNNSNPPNTTLQDIQGLWYNLSYTSGAGNGVQTHVYSANNCKVDFSNNLMAAPNFYYMYGNWSNCSHPQQSSYFYDPNTNLISGGALVESVNSTDMHLSANGGSTNFSGVDYYLTKTAPTYSPTETLSWKVELIAPYPNAGEVDIRIVKSWDLGNPIIVPVIPNQTLYTGSLSVNTASSNYIYLTVINSDNNLQNPNTIEFYNVLTVGNVTSYLDTNLFCVGSQACTVGAQLTTGGNYITFN